MELSEAHDDVLRKIGRNMLMFQRFELWVKEIIALSDVQGHPKEVEAIIRRNRERVARATLGNLVAPYAAANFSDKSKFAPPSPEKEPHFSFSFRIDGGEGVADSQKRALALVVEERNKLVHQMLGQYQPGSVESGASLINFLDVQHEMLLPHYELAEQVHAFIQDAVDMVNAEFRGGPVDGG